MSVDDFGNIHGLPPQYSPASATISYGRGMSGERIALSFSLSVGESHVNLPSCLLNALTLDESQEVRFAASWYHDVSVSPPYIMASFLRDDPNQAITAHFVVFALDDLDVLEVHRFKRMESGARKLESFSLSSYCEMGGELNDDKRVY